MLAFAIKLPEFAALAVEYRATKLMAALSAVKLDEDATPVGFIVNDPAASPQISSSIRFQHEHARMNLMAQRLVSSAPLWLPIEAC